MNPIMPIGDGLAVSGWLLTLSGALTEQWGYMSTGTPCRHKRAFITTYYSACYLVKCKEGAEFLIGL